MTDNELLLMESIHIFVEILDVYFSNVCEVSQFACLLVSPRNGVHHTDLVTGVPIVGYCLPLQQSIQCPG